MTIYQDMIEAGVEVSNHCSDLYVLDCEAARDVLKKHGARSTTFRNAIDGQIWRDIPLSFFSILGS